MPLQDDMQLISVDDHVIEHPDVWQSRLPEKHRERGPRIVEKEGGQEAWLFEGVEHAQIGLNAVAGKTYEEYGMDPVRFDQMIPGCYDVAERVSDMDTDGVQAQLCFPSFAGFCGGTFFNARDKELALACVEAYNDFMIDEWCGGAPDRLIPLVILPLWDPQLCAAEIERTAAKGGKAIAFTENPVPMGLPSFHTEHWDPVLAAAEETGMPLCMHFGSSTKVPITALEAPFAVVIALFGTNSMSTTVDLLMSPVFHKFPGLKVALSEGGIGWMPYILERADYTWERHRHYQPNLNFDARPSDLFKEHIFGCFIDDESGIEQRHRIGIGNIMWEGDYPHSDSNWPNSRKRVADMLADVPDDEAWAITEQNARRVFNFERR